MKEHRVEWDDRNGLIVGFISYTHRERDGYGTESVWDVPMAIVLTGGKFEQWPIAQIRLMREGRIPAGY